MTIFDRIATLSPLNRTAGSVTAQSGDHYEPQLPKACGHSDAPGVILRRHPISQGFVDLTGARFGRFTVIGLLPGKRWQVRCACGRYETRAAKAIKVAIASGDASSKCLECAHFDRAKARYAKHGPAPISKFIGGADRRQAATQEG